MYDSNKLSDPQKLTKLACNKPGKVCWFLMLLDIILLDNVKKLLVDCTECYIICPCPKRAERIQDFPWSKGPKCSGFHLLLPAATKLGQGNVFTGICDSVQGQGCLPQCMLGYPPEQTPPQSRHPPGSRRQHTVSERSVRILLECILVFVILLDFFWGKFGKIISCHITQGRRPPLLKFQFNW